MNSKVSEHNLFPLNGLPQAVIDFNYHREHLCLLEKLPEIILQRFHWLSTLTRYQDTNGVSSIS
jgi:hypothetical protein